MLRVTVDVRTEWEGVAIRRTGTAMSPELDHTAEPDALERLMPAFTAHPDIAAALADNRALIRARLEAASFDLDEVTSEPLATEPFTMWSIVTEGRRFAAMNLEGVNMMFDITGDGHYAIRFAPERRCEATVEWDWRPGTRPPGLIEPAVDALRVSCQPISLDDHGSVVVGTPMTRVGDRDVHGLWQLGEKKVEYVDV